MSIRIILKNSSVASTQPTVQDLALGELAINTTDGVIFFKQSNGISESIQRLSASGSATASYALQALSSSFAQTASFLLGSISSASFATTAATASTTPNAIVTASVNSNTITFTKGNGSTFALTVNTGSGGGGGGASDFPFTGSAIISGSLVVTGSIRATQGVTASLFGTASQAISSSFSISSSYADISNIQYVTNSIQSLSQIEVLDYSTDVAVDFTGGKLKLIFGNPATHSISSFSFNSTFATDRFNKVLDDYTASAAWSNGGYTLISASIFEAGSLIAQTGAGTTLNYLTVDSGSHTYLLQITASNPSNGSILVQSASLAGTLSKTNPAAPVVTTTASVQLGGSSNQIEQGATGSITFNSGSGANNGWVLNFVSSSRVSPIFVTGSLTGSASIVIGVTASYSSSGINGSDNSPALVTATFATATFTKIRSLRSGASISASLTQNEIQNIGGWDTTIQGNVGVIKKGTTTATGQSVTITWTGDKYHYIVYNGSLSFLTNIQSSGFGVLSSFASSSAGDYKVYRTNLLQAGGAGTTITYDLT
jgi:hypothetical protein